MAEEASFTHFTQNGKAHMVAVGEKPESKREAVAEATITMSSHAFSLVQAGGMGKGDVLGVARIAGIMAAKRVDQLIPLCHPLAITSAEIDFTLHEAELCIAIRAVVGITGRTGVEMEALTAVSVALLTVYDMAKALDKGMIIGDVRLLAKRGGKSDDWAAPESSGR